MLDEKKGTCCHRCGHVHVKGTSCPTPYLKGERSCVRRESITDVETQGTDTLLEEYRYQKNEAYRKSNGVDYFRNAKKIVDIYAKKLKILTDKYNANL